jgi:hypothetical protein
MRLEILNSTKKTAAAAAVIQMVFLARRNIENCVISKQISVQNIKPFHVDFLLGVK